MKTNYWWEIDFDPVDSFYQVFLCNDGDFQYVKYYTSSNEENCKNFVELNDPYDVANGKDWVLPKITSIDSLGELKV